jgi:hypothetical protein
MHRRSKLFSDLITTTSTWLAAAPAKLNAQNLDVYIKLLRKMCARESRLVENRRQSRPARQIEC